jgi:hypothetical protein
MVKEAMLQLAAIIQEVEQKLDAVLSAELVPNSLTIDAIDWEDQGPVVKPAAASAPKPRKVQSFPANEPSPAPWPPLETAVRPSKSGLDPKPEIPNLLSDFTSAPGAPSKSQPIPEPPKVVPTPSDNTGTWQARDIQFVSPTSSPSQSQSKQAEAPKVSTFSDIPSYAPNPNGALLQPKLPESLAIPPGTSEASQFNITFSKEPEELKALMHKSLQSDSPEAEIVLTPPQAESPSPLPMVEIATNTTVTQDDLAPNLPEVSSKTIKKPHFWPLWWWLIGAILIISVVLFVVLSSHRSTPAANPVPNPLPPPVLSPVNTLPQLPEDAGLSWEGNSLMWLPAPGDSLWKLYRLLQKWEPIATLLPRQTNQTWLEFRQMVQSQNPNLAEMDLIYPSQAITILRFVVPSP